MSDPMANLVRAAYEPVVLDMLKRTPILPPLTEEQRQRLRELEDAEMRRRENLMRLHLNEPGTTSICRCGHQGYSTPGYLLHLYDVIAADATDHGGLE